jgi:GTP diphosphokinase / guanosine-3',5'-bis(diphosphate) 3'-diphosphatase
LAAAALHDTIEDTKTTKEGLGATFSEEIAQIVFELTDDKSLPKEERKRSQIEHAPQIGRERAREACRQNLQSA